ncbi:MAG TPA: LPS assembly lipoprotein LptE [Burkholderiales bacterium]|nr:LPS assembly lipoprotein LptE [Burkholderiales bacterium]
MRRSLRWLVVCLAPILLSACGFHLRGSTTTALPEALNQLRVLVTDSKLVNEPLRVIMTNTLQAGADVTVTDDPGVPALLLSSERADVQVIAVNVLGRASAYTMRYEVTYRVIEAGGKVLLPTQSVRLLRDYTFDPVNVLAKEREEQDLKRAMQREAAQQIVRRLARSTLSDRPVDATRP